METINMLLENAKGEILQVLYRADGHQKPGSNIFYFNMNDWRMSAPTARRQIEAFESLQQAGLITIYENSKVVTLTEKGINVVEEYITDSNFSLNSYPMKNTITPDLKDKLLTWIIDQPDDLTFTLIPSDVAVQFHVGTNTMKEMLHHFENLGLIGCHRLAGGAMLVTVKTKAYDVQQLGGFSAEREQLILSLEKLKLELSNLKGQVDKDNFDIIMTSINTIMAAMSLFKS